MSLSGPLPITDLVLPSSLGTDFHYTTIFWTLIVLPNLFPQHKVVGLLNSARECVRPSLLVFLFSEPPYPAGVVIVVIVVGPLPITNLNTNVF